MKEVFKTDIGVEEIKVPKVETKTKDEIINELKENLEIKNNKIVEISMLFSLMSHDLRSPFQGILGFLEVCKTDVKNGDFEDLEENLSRIESSAEHTLSLLDDLLLWSKLNMNKVEVKAESIKLKEMIEDVVKSSDLVAHRKEISVINEIDENANISTDVMMLKNIIRNLVSNAIKFTDREGMIRLYSNNVGDSIKIYVEDNGVGIKRENLVNFFDKFGASTNGTAGEKGTGFGLSIVQKMTDMLGGKIEVESEGEGKGATFVLTLPESKE